RQVERHLEEWPGCRALVADLRTVRAAAFTLDRQEPPASLLASLQARIAAEPAAPERATRWPNTPAAWSTWLAAAAALVLATAMSVMPLLRQAPDAAPAAPVEDAALVDSVEADLKAAEAHYEKAIQGLEQIARSNSDELEPQVAAVLQKNLQVVD